MALEIAYQLLREPQACVDGSGQVAHDIVAVGREEGTSDPWVTIPNHHKSFLLLSLEIDDALDQPTDAEIVRTYKDYLRANVQTPANPLPRPVESDWSEEGLRQFAADYVQWEADFTAHNQASADAEARVVQYIVGRGWDYPIQFRLNI